MRRIGIDLGLRSAHQAVIYDGPTRKGRPFKVPQTKDGIDALEQRALADTEGPCEVVMDPTGLAWLPIAAEMARRGHRIYVPKPSKTHALRKFYRTFAKSDVVDAKAHALVRHADPDGVHELRIPTAQVTSLKRVVKQRARLVSDVSKAKQRIHGWLILGNPHLMAALGKEPFSKVGTAFLRRFINPADVVKRGKATLRCFWKRQSHGRFNEKQFAAVYAACETTETWFRALCEAKALPFDTTVIQQLIGIELDRIDTLSQQTVALDTLIKSLMQAIDPETTLEREVPGVGPTTAAAVEAFVGDVERFDTISAFAAFFGLVPRTNLTAEKVNPGSD